ncbi:LuxR C-terminal-related transcriptional regulator [Bacillus cereus]|uniref:LuxR C-terminal-related transcriptional regulator n=1 Tax=Bacillus cereus TaxID=1396 RepID=UPI003D6476E6
MNKDFQIISTKLIAPVPRKNYVEREHIIRKLQHIYDYKVIVIKGEAGSGKTTVLASFLLENPHLSATWISLDRENNTLFSFWHYMLASLRHFIKGGDDLLSLFQTIMHKAELENIIVSLINLLNVEENITIVLDDFHCIDDQDVCESIMYFIKYSSSNVRVIFLMRNELSIYIGDLLVEGKVLEIDNMDLRFSSLEGEHFIQRTLGLNMKRELLQKMNSLAEGWIGGLQLLALARIDRNDELKNIKVLNKHVIAYLSNEILKSLEEEEKDFLIKTSILNYFNENICNELLGIENAKEILTRLLQKHLFIIIVDENAGIYRYHAIFQKFLQHYCNELSERENLYIHASNIYEHLNDFDECIKLLLEVKNYELALSKIEKNAQNRKGWGYLRCIPLSFVVKRREMALQLIFYYYCNLELERCKELLKAIYEQSNGVQPWRLFDFCKALVTEENLYVDVQLIHEIDEMNVSDVTKAIMYVEFSFFLRYQDRVQDALYMLKKAQRIEEKLENPYVKMVIFSSLSQIKEDLGDLNECEVLYKAMNDLMKQYPSLSSLEGSCAIGITGVYAKRMQLHLAEQSLQRVSSKELALEKAYLYNVMEVQVLKGEKQNAKGTIEKLQTFSIYKNEQYLASVLKYAVELSEDYTEQIEKFILMYHEKMVRKKLRIEDKLLYAKIIFRKGNVQEALQLVDEVAEFTRKNKMKLMLIEAILLKIYILKKEKNDMRELLNLMREAIYYSYENHIISPYILMMEQIKPLLIQLKKERIESINKEEKKFIYILLGGNEQRDSVLSQRELEVLKVLSTGAKNKEIAERLCISIATVKTHIINIYAKLEVSNRVEAINKATEDGLIL